MSYEFQSPPRSSPRSRRNARLRATNLALRFHARPTLRHSLSLGKNARALPYIAEIRSCQPVPYGIAVARGGPSDHYRQPGSQRHDLHGACLPETTDLGALDPGAQTARVLTRQTVELERCPDGQPCSRRSAQTLRTGMGPHRCPGFSNTPVPYR